MQPATRCSSPCTCTALNKHMPIMAAALVAGRFAPCQQVVPWYQERSAFYLNLQPGGCPGCGMI